MKRLRTRLTNCSFEDQREAEFVCVCSGWVCNLLELSEEAWQHACLTAPGHRIQGSSVTLLFRVPSLALIGTSLEINENDILCSSCSRHRTLEKGPSQFITHSIYIAMALKHYLWDVNFLSAVNNLYGAEAERKKILRVCMYVSVYKNTHIFYIWKIFVFKEPLLVVLVFRFLVNCLATWQSPAALSDLSKIPCTVKGTSSAASPRYTSLGQVLQETTEPTQQSLQNISEFGIKK